MGLSCCKPSSQEASHHFPILAFWHSLWLGTLLKGPQHTSRAVRVSSQQRAAASEAGTCVLLGCRLCSCSCMGRCISVLQWHQIHHHDSSLWGGEVHWLSHGQGRNQGSGRSDDLVCAWVTRGAEATLMGTLSWIYLHLLSHGNGWAEHVWEHPLPGRLKEVLGVGKCIYVCLGVCEPSREKNPLVSSVGRCCLICSYSFVISSQQFSWWCLDSKPTRTQNLGPWKLWFPGSVSSLSDLPALQKWESVFPTCIRLEVELSPLAQGVDFPMCSSHSSAQCLPKK